MRSEPARVAAMASHVAKAARPSSDTATATEGRRDLYAAGGYVLQT